MTDFRFDKTLGTAERAALVDLFGEQAVRNHAVFLANFTRIHGLFPRHQLTLAELNKMAEHKE